MLSALIDPKLYSSIQLMLQLKRWVYYHSVKTKFIERKENPRHQAAHLFNERNANIMHLVYQLL